MGVVGRYRSPRSPAFDEWKAGSSAERGGVEKGRQLKGRMKRF